MYFRSSRSRCNRSSRTDKHELKERQNKKPQASWKPQLYLYISPKNYKSRVLAQNEGPESWVNTQRIAGKSFDVSKKLEKYQNIAY